MKTKYDNKNKTLWIEFTEEIDHYMVEKIRHKADFEIQKNMPQKVILDFAKVTFMDSAGIGLIIGRYKTASIFGGKLYLENVSKSVRKVLEMAGILKIIEIIDNVGGEQIEECI